MPVPFPDLSTPDLDVRIQPRIELGTPHGHLDSIEGILHNKIGV